MTQQEMIETIKASHPEKLNKRIRTMLNDANDRFVMETKVVRETIDEPHTSGKIEYDMSSMTNSAGGELREILSVNMKDFDNDSFRWFVDNNDVLNVGVLSSTGDAIKSIDTSGLTLEIGGVFSDPGLDGEDLQSEPNYPKAFHRALVSRVQEQLHAEKGNVNMARYYKNDYEERVIDAKRYVGSGGVRGDWKVHQAATDSKRIPG